MDTALKWPDEARIAVTLTFDFDAETLWLSRDPTNAKRPGTLSQGTYGAKVAVPKIVELLQEAGLDGKATFFVPGWTAEHHTSRVELVLRHGHEVGHHGYLHEWIDPDFPDKEVEALEKGLAALKKTVGVTPKGYRSPAGETSDNMIALLTKHGFVYDTSLMDDVNPYRHASRDGARGPIELPWHWSLDDAVYALFSIKNPRPIFAPEQVLSVWKAEFQELYRWGGYFNLVMHPQVSGRPSRLATLREFIAWMRSFPAVWFATCTEVAETWSRLNER